MLTCYARLICATPYAATAAAMYRAMLERIGIDHICLTAQEYWKYPDETDHDISFPVTEAQLPALIDGVRALYTDSEVYNVTDTPEYTEILVSDLSQARKEHPERVFLTMFIEKEKPS